MLFKGTTIYGTTNYSEEKKLLKKIEILYDKHRSLSSIDIKKEKLWQKINDISLDAAKFAIPNEYDKMLSAIGAKIQMLTHPLKELSILMIFLLINLKNGLN